MTSQPSEQLPSGGGHPNALKRGLNLTGALVWIRQIRVSSTAAAGSAREPREDHQALQDMQHAANHPTPVGIGVAGAGVLAALFKPPGRDCSLARVSPLLSRVAARMAVFRV